MDNGQQFQDLRAVSPSDHIIDWDTWHRVVEWFRARGFTDLENLAIGNDVGESEGVPFTFARLGLRRRVANAAGKIPDDTDVYMWEAVEVGFDSSTNQHVDKPGGMTWNGGGAGTEFDQNLLRLVGQPGFGDESYNYGPLLSGAIVPVFKIYENAGYSAASERGTEITLVTYSWGFTFMGEDPVVHPFKCRVSDTDPMDIVVGYMRDFDTNAGTGADVANISHTGADYITVLASGADSTVIELDTADTISIPASTTDGFVYYEVDTVSPGATLKFSAVWPPATDPQVPIFLVCKIKVAAIASVEQIFVIGQHQFSQVTLSSGGADTFLALTDTEDDYTDNGGDLVRVNQAEDGLIFQPIVEHTFWAVSDPDYQAMAPAHAIVKEDLSEFCAICFEDDDPCSLDLCSPDPSVGITVTGASGTINMCGETWVLPGESGVTKCVCPLIYLEDFSDTMTYTTHAWSYDGFGSEGLRLVRQWSTLDLTPAINQSGNVRINGLQSKYLYHHYTSGTYQTSYYSSLMSNTFTNTLAPTQITGNPVVAHGKGVRPMRIPDEYFFEYTDAGITYKIERGNAAEWPA